MVPGLSPGGPTIPHKNHRVMALRSRDHSPLVCHTAGAGRLRDKSGCIIRRHRVGCSAERHPSIANDGRCVGVNVGYFSWHVRDMKLTHNVILWGYGSAMPTLCVNFIIRKRKHRQMGRTGYPDHCESAVMIAGRLPVNVDRHQSDACNWYPAPLP